MTHGPRQPLLTAIVVVMAAALAFAACDPVATTPTSGPTSTPGSTTSTAPAAEPSSTASAAASAAPPSSATEACAIAPQTGRLPSDRLVDIEFPPATGADVVTFVFGDDSLPGPASAPEGTLETAEPPFIQGGSGEPQVVEGEHVALVRFAGMSISNDVGQTVYQGELEFHPELPALRHVVNMEMFEGVVSWYIGYDGPGCLTLEQDGRNVSIAIQHPAS